LNAFDRILHVRRKVRTLRLARVRQYQQDGCEFFVT
jgi:hypothetical protein